MPISVLPSRRWTERSLYVHNQGVTGERGVRWTTTCRAVRRAWRFVVDESWRRRLTVSGGPFAIMVGVSTLGAPLLPPHYSGNQLGPKVGMVGDSITCLSSNYLANEFDPNYAEQIGCKNGITIAQGTVYAQSIDHSLQGSPSAFIVNLGTNDALQDEHDIGPHNDVDIGAVWKALTALSSDISNVSCVIWVTVNEVPDVYGSQVAAAINDWIGAWTSSHKGNYEINWSSLLRQGDNSAQWLSDRDGIHTTEIGQKELASLYLQAEQVDCPQNGVLPSS